MRILLCLLCVALGAAGCNQNSAPPPPLSVEQLPPALEKAFAPAPAGRKDLAAEIGAAVKAAEYPEAFAGLQALAGAGELTKEQNSVVTRGMLTMNGLLQSEQAQGDTQAATALQDFRRSK